jgi:hypothetical protein
MPSTRTTQRFVAVLSASLAAGCNHESPSVPYSEPLSAQTPAARVPDPVERGKLLVGLGGCNDCHTPLKFDEKLGMPVPQLDRMLSGHPEGAPGPGSTLAKGDQAVIGPTFTSFLVDFGIVYSANLTPDAQTGLGSWNEKTFIATMRTGNHLGVPGRPMLPPMPWMNLNQLPDDDLRAIWAYLKSVPAIANRVPPPKVPPPVYEEIGKGYAAALAAMEKH